VAFGLTARTTPPGLSGLPAGLPKKVKPGQREQNGTIGEEGGKSWEILNPDFFPGDNWGFDAVFRITS